MNFFITLSSGFFCFLIKGEGLIKIASVMRGYCLIPREVVPSELADQARRAQENCPEEAIALVDDSRRPDRRRPGAARRAHE